MLCNCKQTKRHGLRMDRRPMVRLQLTLTGLMSTNPERQTRMTEDNGNILRYSGALVDLAIEL